jgi:hypothetical protein
MPRGKPKFETPSIRVRLEGNIRAPVTDPRVQKTIDWIKMQRKSRQAFPMAFDLLVAAVNGELSSVPLAALEAGDQKAADAALDDLLAAFSL